jgi:hypothetical protein
LSIVEKVKRDLKIGTPQRELILDRTRCFPWTQIQNRPEKRRRNRKLKIHSVNLTGSDSPSKISL